MEENERYTGENTFYEDNGRDYSRYSFRKDEKKEPGNGCGIASLILGITSILLFCTCVNWITAVIAIILGIVQLVRGGRRGLAIGGIVTAAVSLLLSIVFYTVVGMASYRNYYDYYNYNYYDNYSDYYDYNGYDGYGSYDGYNDYGDYGGYGGYGSYDDYNNFQDIPAEKGGFDRLSCQRTEG